MRLFIISWPATSLKQIERWRLPLNFKATFFENMNVMRHKTYFWLGLLSLPYILLHLKIKIKKTWKNFREEMSKSLQNSELQTCYGAAATSLQKCKVWIFNQMLFLRDILANRKTESNLEASYILLSPTNRYSPLFRFSFDKKTPLLFQKVKEWPWKLIL